MNKIFCTKAIVGTSNLWRGRNDHILDDFDRNDFWTAALCWMRRAGSMDIRCEIVRKQPRALLNETHRVGSTCLNSSHQPHHSLSFFLYLFLLSSFPPSGPSSSLSLDDLVLVCSRESCSFSPFRFARSASTCLFSWYNANRSANHLHILARVRREGSADGGTRWSSLG